MTYSLCSTLLALMLAPVAMAAPALTINGGSPYSRNASVTLSLAGLSDEEAMCVSNSATCKGTREIETPLTWAVKPNGKREVTVVLSGPSGSSTFKSSIVVDNKPPTGGKLVATYGNGQNVLAWSGHVDALSGVASYALVGGAGRVAPACSSPVLYSGSETTYTHTGLTNGQVYSYRVCATDGAGNQAPGGKKTDIVSATPRPESDAPTGSVSINSGAEFTRNRSVTLTIDANDASDVTEMCVSERAACKGWRPFATTLSFSLTKAAGTKTVRVWLRDEYTNETKSPITDTIILDNRAPTGGRAAAIACDGALALNWSSFADPQSCVASYRVYVQPGKKVPKCGGLASYSGTAIGQTVSGLTNGVKYGYAVCAVDRLGNVQKKGGGGIATPTADIDCPTSPAEGTGVISCEPIVEAGDSSTGDGSTGGGSTGGDSTGGGSTGGGSTGGGSTGGGSTGGGSTSTLDPSRFAAYGCTLSATRTPQTALCTFDVDWNTAKTRCESMGGRLAIARSDADHQVLANMVVNGVAYGNRWGGIGAWIGLTQQWYADGQWRWMDGSVATTTYWAAGEPNNAGSNGLGEDCVVMFKAGSTVRWNDLICTSSLASNQQPYLCEAN